MTLRLKMNRPHGVFDVPRSSYGCASTHAGSWVPQGSDGVAQVDEFCTSADRPTITVARNSTKERAHLCAACVALFTKAAFLLACET